MYEECTPLCCCIFIHTACTPAALLFYTTWPDLSYYCVTGVVMWFGVGVFDNYWRMSHPLTRYRTLALSLSLIHFIWSHQAICNTCFYLVCLLFIAESPLFFFYFIFIFCAILHCLFDIIFLPLFSWLSDSYLILLFTSHISGSLLDLDVNFINAYLETFSVIFLANCYCALPVNICFQFFFSSQ